MQFSTVTPAKEASPPRSRSPSPLPSCSTSTPRIRSESKKRPIEDEEDEEVRAVDVPSASEVDNASTSLRQNKEKQRKFFLNRDQTDKDTELYDIPSTKTASLMFDEVLAQKKDKTEGSPEGVKRETSSIPRTYKHKASTSSFRSGVSPQLQGKPNIISKKPTPTSSFYGQSDNYNSYKHFGSSSSTSPYFPAGKRLGTNRFGVPHPGFAKRNALSPLHNNTSRSPIKRLSLLDKADKDEYNFNNENESFNKSPEKIGCSYLDKKTEEVHEVVDDNNLKIIPSHEVGFQNLGNTCYINSTIQILLGLQPFCSDVIAEPSLMSRHLPTLEAIIKYSQSGQQAHAMGALKMLRDKFTKHVDGSFQGMKQQDASEFLCKLLDGIRDEIKSTRKNYFPLLNEENSKNIIEDNFEVLMDEKDSCKDCEKAREEKQKHLQLFLSFPTEEIEKEDEDGLLAFTDSLEKKMSIQSLIEQVLGSHTIKCVGCESENGIRHTKLTSLPRILLVQLKRYNNQSEKIRNPAIISPYIELDNLVTDDCASPKSFRFPKQNVGVQTAINEEIDPEEDEFRIGLKLSLKAQQDAQDSDIQEALRRSLLDESNAENWSEDEIRRVWSRPQNATHAYRLVGIILHEGFGTKQGHYTATVYKHTVKKWMHYSDTVSREVETNELLGLKNQKNCYLLAYMHQDIFEVIEKASEENEAKP